MSISSINMSPPGSLGTATQTAPVSQPPQTPQPAQTSQTVSQTGNPPSESPHSLDQVKQAANQINKVIQTYDQNLQFVVDHSSGKVLVQIVDTADHKVIRQIPSKEAIAISQALDKLQGLLIRQQA